MLAKFKNTYRRFDRNFWLLMAISFIDMLGGSLIFPFFSLYMSRKFGVGMTEVGFMFLVWALTSGLIGNIVGGALADKFGRKTNIVFGLTASAVSALAMVVIDDLILFYVFVGVIGIFEDIAGPARQAMVADLVPEDQRADAYGIFRIVFNLAAAIAPAIGGYMVARSFETLFVVDVIISSIAALLVLLFLPETKPETDEQKQEQSLMDTLKGYKAVFRDKVFIIFIAVSALSTLMYFNMNSTLSVYLVDYHSLPPQQYGLILTVNAAMVVFMQMFFTRMIASWKPMIAIAIGNILYVVGFTMYGFVTTFLWFLIAMIVITIGEMIYSPKGQMVSANMAPEHMRGRYMAINNFAWVIPIAIGPLAAGLIIDNLDPRMVWYFAGGVGTLSVIGFLLLHKFARERFNVIQVSAAEGELEADIPREKTFPLAAGE